MRSGAAASLNKMFAASLLVFGSHAEPTVVGCSWDDLSSGQSECATRALQIDGAVAITGVPGLARAREEAMRSVAECGISRPQDFYERKLADGTIRRTLGARTHDAASHPVDTGCEHVAHDTDGLRAIVDMATRRFVRSLEVLVRDDAELPGGFASLSQLVSSGEALEHFHEYSRPIPEEKVAMSASDAERPSATPTTAATTPGELAATVPLHTDAGLFIAIVPAIYLLQQASGSPFEADRRSEQPSDFIVLRGDGTTARLAPHAARDGLLFLVGDGWDYWINPHMRTPLRAAPHAMTMPPLTMTMAPTMGSTGAAAPRRLVRLWHGRMVLPPQAAQMPSGVRFDEWRRAHVSAASRRLDISRMSGAVAAGNGTNEPDLPAGCAGGGLLLPYVEDCAHGTVHCWMRCMPLPTGLPCADHAVCVNPTTNKSADPSKMCPSCKPGCPPPPSPPAPNKCTGMLSDMSMSGFVHGDATCLMLLVAALPLDSPIRMTIGVIVTLLAGLLVEAITWVRRSRLPTLALATRLPALWTLLALALFSMQTALAYALMLIAMTYQLELFVSVIGGLALGHVAFNLRAPVPESADPCCVDEPANRSVQGGGVAPLLARGIDPPSTRR